MLCRRHSRCSTILCTLDECGKVSKHVLIVQKKNNRKPWLPLNAVALKEWILFVWSRTSAFVRLVYPFFRSIWFSFIIIDIYGYLASVLVSLHVNHQNSIVLWIKLKASVLSNEWKRKLFLFGYFAFSSLFFMIVSLLLKIM